MELLDAYYRLWLIAAEEDKAPLLARLRGVVSVTYEDRYHDMLAVTDAQFKEDATSYMRAAFLMDQLGFDTRRYQEAIVACKPRLDAHMAQRGPHQQLSFHEYYKHFGLDEPFPLADALTDGLIAKRAAPAALPKRQIYDFTHEIFVPYGYGDRLDADPFSEADKRYIASVLDALVPRYVTSQDPDIVAELVACARYVRAVDGSAYQRGISYLLSSQSPDGSWGRYDRARDRLGDYVRQGLLLHTTTVAIVALTAAFHEPWNRTFIAWCPGFHDPLEPMEEP